MGDQVSADGAARDQERQVPRSGAEAGTEQGFRQFLHPDAPLLHGLAVLLAQAELFHRDCGANEPVDDPCGGQPVDRHATDEHDQSQIAFVLPDQLAHQRHRGCLSCHVLQCDHVAVINQRCCLCQCGDFLLHRQTMKEPFCGSRAPPSMTMVCPVT